MKSADLDEKFNNNEEDVLQHFNLSSVRFINETPKRINVDFPIWMVQSLDKEAKHIGVSRQAIIKTWVADRLNNNLR